MQRTKEAGELLLRAIQYILREQSAAWAKLDQRDAIGRFKRSPHLFELPRQQSSENSVDIARSVKVTGSAELRGGARIVSKLRIVKTDLHVAREWNRPALADFRFNLLPQLLHRP